MAAKSLRDLNQKYRGKPKKYAEGGRARRPAAAPVPRPSDEDYLSILADRAVGAGEPVAELRSSEGRGFAPTPFQGEGFQRMSAMLRGEVEPTPGEQMGLNIVRGFTEGPAGIRVYHASPHLFDRFEPSQFRRASFFASNPERARIGAGSGVSEMIMETATELPKQKMNIYEVDIDPSKIRGLQYTPTENEWFNSLPARIVGDSELEKIWRSRPKSVDINAWDDIYTPIQIGPREYLYTRKDAPPILSYEDAISTGRDIYGQRHSHYGYGADEKRAAEITRGRGMGGYLVNDEAGLSIGVIDPNIINITRRYAEGGLAELDQKYAEGGRARRPAAAPVPRPSDEDYLSILADRAVGAGEPVAELRSSEGRGFAPMPRSFGEAGQRLSAVIRGDVEPTPEEERQISHVRGFTESPASIRAYHGSPYRFDRFDISKIGSGEGNQTFGHGLYFAELEPVARRYRDTLSRPYYELASGEPLVKKYGNDVLDVFENVGGDPNQIKETINRLRNSVQRNLNDFGVKNVSQLNPLYAGDFASDTINMARRADNLEDLLRSGDVKLAGQGHMYEVNLRTEPENLLSLDAPIAAQARNIRDELKAAGILKAYRENLSDFTSPMLTRNRTPRGENIMSFLEYSKGSPEAAASALSDIGIPGLRYLDEGSRAAGRGTHNYVMFGDDLIDITRRYAEGGLAELDQKYADGGMVREPATAYDPDEIDRIVQEFAEGGEVEAPAETTINGQDHKLAYITDREAALLKARGGSGRMTKHGIRAYDEGPGEGPGSDNANSMSEAATQDAVGGNQGQGAGPTGAGAGGGPPGAPDSNPNQSMSSEDPEGTQAAANMQTAVDAREAGRGYGIADTGGVAPTGFNAAPGIAEALGALGRGEIGFGQALGYGVQSAISPPGVQMGVNVDELGNQTPAVSVSVPGVIGGLMGLATGIPGASAIGSMIGNEIGKELGLDPTVMSYEPGVFNAPEPTPAYGAAGYGMDYGRGYAHGGLAKLHAKYAGGGSVSAYDPRAVDQLAKQIEAQYV